MYIEKSLKEALEDYMLGRPVTVLWTGNDGGMNQNMRKTWLSS